MQISSGGPCNRLVALLGLRSVAWAIYPCGTLNGRGRIGSGYDGSYSHGWRHHQEARRAARPCSENVGD